MNDHQMTGTEEEMLLCCVGNTEQEDKVQHSGLGGDIRWFVFFIHLYIGESARAFLGRWCV
jgi:hypothetical protein